MHEKVYPSFWLVVYIKANERINNYYSVIAVYWFPIVATKILQSLNKKHIVIGCSQTQNYCCCCKIWVQVSWFVKLGAVSRRSRLSIRRRVYFLPSLCPTPCCFLFHSCCFSVWPRFKKPLIWVKPAAASLSHSGKDSLCTYWTSAQRALLGGLKGHIHPPDWNCKGHYKNTGGERRKAADLERT